MEIVVLKMSLFISVSADFGKHVYVGLPLKWKHAQAHCRLRYSDLSPIASLSDEERLENLTAGIVPGEFWTGLYYEEAWKWSGVENSTYFPPNLEAWNLSGSYFASLCLHSCSQYGWQAVYETKKLPFFCFKPIVVRIRMAWEEALEHCEQERTSLTSLMSEAELQLARTAIQQNLITDRVWIGLRYLGERWLWVNGDPLEYQAWPQGVQDHQCPVEGRCGALTKEGLWENWDCQEKLDFICY